MNQKSEYYEYEDYVPDEKTDARSINLSEQVEEDEFVYEPQQFTWRASIVGSLLGCVVAASNLYLGLQIGWMFGAALWGSIFGFLVLKFMSRITGTVFGPKENVICQTAATTSGGLTSGFVTAIPAMYRMGLMGNHKPTDDLTDLLLWTTCSAFFGMFFAVPLRAHFVINQDLVFPTPRAAAETIKSLHRAGSASARDARSSGIAMTISFVGSMIWHIIGYWIPGLFNSLHVLYFIGKAASYQAMQNADLRWAWYFSWDWAFFGAGLMTPGNTVCSFVLGTLVAYGIGGPLMVSAGILSGRTGFLPPPAAASAQSWFLWPGIGLMVFTAFSELGARSTSLIHGMKEGIRETRNVIRKLQKKNPLLDTSGYVSNDPTPVHELIPTWWWILGLILSGIMTIMVMYFNFNVPVYATIGSIFLSFILAFVGLQASGETDINPTGAVAKVAQLVFSRLPGADLQVIQKANLMCANVAASVCSQSVDMVADLKTGQLLNVSPKAMFWAQMVGSVFAIGVAIPLFILYTTAYPCILDSSMENCPFAAPAVVAWENVCKLLTGQGTIPRSSLITAVICCILGVANVVIREKFVPNRWKPYWINLNAFGLGFISPAPYIPLAMAAGWITTKVWRHVNTYSHDRMMYSVSAGLIAGVGIAGLIKAAMTIVGVPEGTVRFGCYDEVYC